MTNSAILEGVAIIRDFGQIEGMKQVANTLILVQKNGEALRITEAREIEARDAITIRTTVDNHEWQHAYAMYAYCKGYKDGRN